MTLSTMSGNDLAQYMRRERLKDGRFTINWDRVRREMFSKLDLVVDFFRPQIADDYSDITADEVEVMHESAEYWLNMLRDGAAALAIIGFCLMAINWLKIFETLTHG